MKSHFASKKLACGVLSIGLLVSCAGSVSAQTNIDVGVAGKSVHREILGNTTIHIRPGLVTGDKASEVGMAGGLLADEFDWRVPQSKTPNWVLWDVYEFMRRAADRDSMYSNIVNMRGIWDSGGSYNTSVAPLVTMASEWVRYTNHIIQNYHNGDAIPAGDQAILDKINWTYFTKKLPNPGESAPPPVNYWIIGNEPEIKVNGKWFSGNWIDTTFGGAWTTAEYVNRYSQITAAMKAQDPTIKVGPGMLGTASEDTFGPLLQSSAPIDFWAYHIYDNISDFYVPNGNASQVNAMEAQLRTVRSTQINRYNGIRQTFINNGRNPDNVEFMQTEWNVMNVEWDDANQPSMYQALGAVETFFSFAQMGLRSANFWGETKSENIFGPVGPNELVYPMVKAWWMLRDKMGDTLVDSIASDSSNQRVYTTRDSQSGVVRVWGLNFDNDADASIALSLLGLGDVDSASLYTLNAGAGTRLWSQDVDWTQQSLINFNPSSFNLDIPTASIVMLELTPVPEPAAIGLVGLTLFGLARRRHR